MSLDFANIFPQIDQILDDIASEAHEVKGLILTEDDLKCILHNRLRSIPELQGPFPTQDQDIYASAVHAEVSWYGEARGNARRRLAIKPDITIMEPEHLSILHGYISPISHSSQKNIVYGCDRFGRLVEQPPELPRKDFEFGGKAITFELKFIRSFYFSQQVISLIMADFSQIQRLFTILDERGEGHTIFSYMIVFDKYEREVLPPDLEYLFNNERESHRHKIVYKNIGVRRR